MFIENVVDLFVERQQVVIHHLHAVPGIERLLQVVELGLALLGCLVNRRPSGLSLKVFWRYVRVGGLWLRLGLLLVFILHKLMPTAIGSRCRIGRRFRIHG